MSNRSGGPGPPLFSVFCFSTRPPARHPEAARPPTYREIKNARPRGPGVPLSLPLKTALYAHCICGAPYRTFVLEATEDCSA